MTASDYRGLNEEFRHMAGKRIGAAIAEALDNGPTPSELIERINEFLGEDSGATERNVSDWRRRASDPRSIRSFPPYRLWAAIGYVLWGDPTRIAQLAGAIPDVDETVKDILAVQHSITRLRAAHAKLVDAAESSPSAATAQIVEAIGRPTMQGKWRVAVSPVVEGPPGYAMRVSDRLDFALADGGTPKAAELEKDLAELFATHNVQVSKTIANRWVSPHEGGTVDKYLRYSIGFTTNDFPPPAAAPYLHINSIAVVTATSELWTYTVGAMLARVLGLGFTTSRGLAKNTFGFAKRKHMLDRLEIVHRQLLAQPWRKYVWSHLAAAPDERMLPTPDSTPLNHVSVVLTPVGGAGSDYETLRKRAELLRAAGQRVIEVPMQVIDPKTDPARTARWELVFKTVFEIRRRLVDEGIISSVEATFSQRQLSARAHQNITGALAKWNSDQGSG
ncbi:hypothetical protein [Dietzia maris]|uniref:hypothetical protein n=1 Tax=Dietzia maris TaxID=37915 RepID=UPI001046F5F7